MITYEHPLNERIRTLLRLEDLFEKNEHFLQQDTAFDHHAALLMLFEILELLARSDLKVDLIHELDRQRQTLLSYHNNPEISEEALSGALYEIEQATSSLHTMNGKIGQQLRDNEWLMSIKSRAAIPGGVCEFDLPSYHWWLHRPPNVRSATLLHWVSALSPLRESVAIILRLLRASGQPCHNVAKQGQFQLSLGNSAAQMVRLLLNSDEQAVPEVSANKYMLNIRFVRPPMSEAKTRTHTADVPFDLVFCSL